MKTLLTKIAALRLRLIEDWRKAHTFASVQLTAIFAFIFGLGPSLVHSWAFIPDDLKTALPQGTARWIAMGAFLLTLLGRVTKLEPKELPGEQQ